MHGISIIITYYKGEKFIFHCLNSLINSYSLSNKKLDYELIIIIDSMDDAYYINELLYKSFKSLGDSLKIVINESNLGVSESRNIGLSISKYRYFTIIDQDDYVLESYFTSIENELNGFFSAYIVNGYIKYVDNNKLIPIYYFKPKFEFKSILYKNTLIYTPGLIIFDSEHVQKSNFFIDTSEKYKGCDDWAAYLTLLIRNNIKYKYLSNKVFVYCLHTENYSNRIDEMVKSSIAVLNYLKNRTLGNSKMNKQIDFSFKMQDFYLAKDFFKLGKAALLSRYPVEFLWHFIFSFANLDRQNRLFFNLKKLKTNKFR